MNMLNPRESNLFNIKQLNTFLYFIVTTMTLSLAMPKQLYALSSSESVKELEENMDDSLDDRDIEEPYLVEISEPNFDNKKIEFTISGMQPNTTYDIVISNITSGIETAVKQDQLTTQTGLSTKPVTHTYSYLPDPDNHKTYFQDHYILSVKSANSDIQSMPFQLSAFYASLVEHHTKSWLKKMEDAALTVVTPAAVCASLAEAAILDIEPVTKVAFAGGTLACTVVIIGSQYLVDSDTGELAPADEYITSLDIPTPSDTFTSSGFSSLGATLGFYVEGDSLIPSMGDTQNSQLRPCINDTLSICLDGVDMSVINKRKKWTHNLNQLSFDEPVVFKNNNWNDGKLKLTYRPVIESSMGQEDSYYLTKLQFQQNNCSIFFWNCWRYKTTKEIQWEYTSTGQIKNITVTDNSSSDNSPVVQYWDITNWAVTDIYELKNNGENLIDSIIYSDSQNKACTQQYDYIELEENHYLLGQTEIHCFSDDLNDQQSQWTDDSGTLKAFTERGLTPPNNVTAVPQLNHVSPKILQYLITSEFPLPNTEENQQLFTYIQSVMGSSDDAINDNKNNLWSDDPNTQLLTQFSTLIPILSYGMSALLPSETNESSNQLNDINDALSQLLNSGESNQNDMMEQIDTLKLSYLYLLRNNKYNLSVDDLAHYLDTIRQSLTAQFKPIVEQKYADSERLNELLNSQINSDSYFKTAINNLFTISEEPEAHTYELSTEGTENKGYIRMAAGQQIATVELYGSDLLPSMALFLSRDADRTNYKIDLQVNQYWLANHLEPWGEDNTINKIIELIKNISNNLAPYQLTYNISELQESLYSIVCEPMASNGRQLEDSDSDDYPNNPDIGGPNDAYEESEDEQIDTNVNLVECNDQRRDSEIELAEISCVICLNSNNEQSITLQCSDKHIFHMQCIRDWVVRNNDTCPTCRRTISDSDREKIRRLWITKMLSEKVRNLNNQLQNINLSILDQYNNNPTYQIYIHVTRNNNRTASSQLIYFNFYIQNQYNRRPSNEIIQNQLNINVGELNEGYYRLLYINGRWRVSENVDNVYYRNSREIERDRLVFDSWEIYDRQIYYLILSTVLIDISSITFLGITIAHDQAPLAGYFFTIIGLSLVSFLDIAAFTRDYSAVGPNYLRVIIPLQIVLLSSEIFTLIL